jgi:SAM-dependent methyltransferase
MRDMTVTDRDRLGPGLAAILALLAAGSVLVLEIAAGRMLAPYVGVSLTTYTGIIGVILAGIAVGAWAGGRAADLYGPVDLLGPTFMLGGLTAMASVPIVDVVGTLGLGTGVGAIVVLATVGFVLPAATLSAVAPMVVRATIVDVATSGSLVGRLSAAGTIGAISGTFLTGFVLLGAVPTRTIILVTGALLVLLGLALALRARRDRRAPRDGDDGDDDGPNPGTTIISVALGLLVVGGATLAAPRPCERESAYFCIRVVEDGGNPGGRTLVLDQLRHAYVDLNDPHHLEFAYIRWFDAAVADRFESSEGDVDALYVGGGGFSFPRHLAAAWPASRHTVLELDPVVFDTAKSELGLVISPALEVTVGDARTSVLALPTDAYDVVVGDAFGSLSVPWHLTTDEFLGEIDRVMRPDGRYVMNLIDGPALSFVRAEVRTLRLRFEHVAVMARPGAFDGIDGGAGGGGNVVLVAAHVPIDVDAIVARLGSSGTAQVRTITGGPALDQFIGDAPLLTDDLAPVDQLIGR